MKITCQNKKYTVEPNLTFRHIEDFLPLEAAAFRVDVLALHTDNTPSDFKFVIHKDDLWCYIKDSGSRVDVWYQYEPSLRTWEQYDAPEFCSG